MSERGNRQWGRLRRPGAVTGLRRGAWYPVLDDQEGVVTLDVNRQSVTVERADVELVADKPRKWSVVRWNAGDDEAKRASQANLGTTYGVCPNCRGRANLSLDDTQRKCPVCELLFEIDWGSEC